MSESAIQFNDGEGYERMMGAWSRLAGDRFLDWLAPPPGQRWVDIGCGNGAFSELIVQRCQPAEVQGIDPAPAQIVYAGSRPGAAGASFQVGDALALPWPDGRFDASVMALVVFFLPDPPAGVREMVRVTRPGGTVCAYAWDLPGGGLPLEPVNDAFRALGKTPPLPPHPEVSTLEALAGLWREAGLLDVETCTITVQRRFESAEDYWNACRAGGHTPAAVAALSDDEKAALKAHVLARFPQQGPVLPTGRANAVRGRVAS